MQDFPKLYLLQLSKYPQIFTLKSRTYGVLLGKPQEWSGLLWRSHPTRILPAGTMLPPYCHINSKGAGSCVGLPGFSELNMQETCLGHLFQGLFQGFLGKQLL